LPARLEHFRPAGLPAEKAADNGMSGKKGAFGVVDVAGSFLGAERSQEKSTIQN